MGVLHIHPLSETHLAGAAHLLEERHERHRASEPLLPDPGDFRAQLERALSAEGAAGSVALVDGEVAAYPIGSPQADGSSEVGLEGCAAREPELIRDLYGHVASGWRAASDDEVRADWAATWDDDRFTHFIAERDGRVAGHILLYRREGGDLRIPEGSIDLSLATTHSDVRGSGVGRALIAHALRWAHDNGYRALTIDWRVVNLLADRFFTARGFRPTFLRLYRHVP